MWQPIETAPKDGTPVLLFDPNGEWDSKWNDFEGRHAPRMAVGIAKTLPNGYLVWKGYYEATDPVENPTHWMPLPNPPLTADHPSSGSIHSPSTRTS